MNNESFVGVDVGLEKILSVPNSALIYYTNIVKHTSLYQHCKIKIIPWKQPLGSASIGLPKDSPLEPFMKQI